jgi:hypothetical protein
MIKFHAAGACEVIVASLRSHGLDTITAESAFRAIYNLSPESNNVSEFGTKGACGLIAAGLLKHQGSPEVLTQACLATYALAVKIKVDKVHNGNTRKLVSKVRKYKVYLIAAKLNHSYKYYLFLIAFVYTCIGSD